MIAGRWIEEAQNLIIEGPAGVGKSWLAAHSATKPVATTARCSISAGRGCSVILHSLAAMAATLD